MSRVVFRVQGAEITFNYFSFSAYRAHFSSSLLSIYNSSSKLKFHLFAFLLLPPSLVQFRSEAYLRTVVYRRPLIVSRSFCRPTVFSPENIVHEIRFSSFYPRSFSFFFFFLQNLRRENLITVRRTWRPTIESRRTPRYDTDGDVHSNFKNILQPGKKCARPTEE